MIVRCEHDFKAAKPVSPLSHSSMADSCKCIADRGVNLLKASRFFIASPAVLEVFILVTGCMGHENNTSLAPPSFRSRPDHYLCSNYCCMHGPVQPHEAYFPSN